MERKEYICKRYRLYSYLTENGFRPIRTIPDAKRADYLNWVYTYTEELDKALDNYFTHEVKTAEKPNINELTKERIKMGTKYYCVYQHINQIMVRDMQARLVRSQSRDGKTAKAISSVPDFIQL